MGRQVTDNSEISKSSQSISSDVSISSSKDEYYDPEDESNDDSQDDLGKRLDI